MSVNYDHHFHDVACLLRHVRENTVDHLLPNGRTPLTQCAFLGNAKFVECLLWESADINAQDSEGYTALHLAVIKSHVTVVQVLLDYGAGLNLLNDNADHLPPFLMMAKFDVKDTSLLEIFLKSECKTLNGKLMRCGAMCDNAGNNALMIAAEENSVNFFKYILNHPKRQLIVHPKHSNHAGETLLHVVARTGFKCSDALYADLAEFGVPVGHQNVKGETIFHLDPSRAIVLHPCCSADVLNLPRWDGARAVHLAAEQFEVQLFEDLVEENEKVTSTACTSLEELLLAGCSVNVTDANGLTPMHYACLSSCVRNMMTLLFHGAEVPCCQFQDQRVPYENVTGSPEIDRILRSAGAIEKDIDLSFYNFSIMFENASDEESEMLLNSGMSQRKKQLLFENALKGPGHELTHVPMLLEHDVVTTRDLILQVVGGDRIDLLQPMIDKFPQCQATDLEEILQFARKNHHIKCFRYLIEKGVVPYSLDFDDRIETQLLPDIIKCYRNSGIDLTEYCYIEHLFRRLFKIDVSKSPPCTVLLNSSNFWNMSSYMAKNISYLFRLGAKFPEPLFPHVNDILQFVVNAGHLDLTKHIALYADLQNVSHELIDRSLQNPCITLALLERAVPWYPTREERVAYINSIDSVLYPLCYEGAKGAHEQLCRPCSLRFIVRRELRGYFNQHYVSTVMQLEFLPLLLKEYLLFNVEGPYKEYLP